MNILCIIVFLFIFVRMCNWLILDNISLFIEALETSLAQPIGLSEEIQGLTRRHY
jgi:hypothetical protein